MNGPADLDIPFLYKIMARMHELPWDRTVIGIEDFLPLLPEELELDDYARLLYVKRHIDYLDEIALLEKNAGNWIKLTPEGRHFVQPELAEFAMQVTSNFISEVESQVESSNLPTEEKEDFRFRLRKTFSDAAPDLAYKLIIEVLVRMAQL